MTWRKARVRPPSNNAQTMAALQDLVEATRTREATKAPLGCDWECVYPAFARHRIDPSYYRSSHISAREDDEHGE